MNFITAFPGYSPNTTCPSWPNPQATNEAQDWHGHGFAYCSGASASDRFVGHFALRLPTGSGVDQFHFVARRANFAGWAGLTQCVSQGDQKNSKRTEVELVYYTWKSFRINSPKADSIL